jgi:ubiquinone/menaquinone biosynthesis C-methylase UbiE
MLPKIEKKTRKLFHSIHSKHLSETTSVSRLRSLISANKLGLSKNYLKNKKCLDAGCGSSFHGSLNLFKMGANEVVALDLNKTIFTHQKKIEKIIPKDKKLTIKVGSVLKLPFKNNSFDFVLCQGVMHHTTNPEKAVKECFRVLKKNGFAYFQICGRGGLIQEFLMDFLRNQIRKDPIIKNFLINLNRSKFINLINYMKSKIKKNGNKENKETLVFFNSLIKLVDEDLILTIKDRVLSPLYYQYDYQQVNKLMKKCKFKKIKRVYTYPIYKNLRNAVSYFYNKPNEKISKILYGSGLINVLCKK